MAVLVTCKFDDDTIKNKGAFCLLNIISNINQWEKVSTFKASNSELTGPIWPWFELV